MRIIDNSVKNVSRGTSKATWKAAYRLARLSRVEQFHHPLKDMLLVEINAAEWLRFIVVDNLAYYQKAKLGQFRYW